MQFPLSASVYRFGPYYLKATQIFFESELCFASVGLRPPVAGQAIVINKRPVEKVSEMTPAELADMFHSAQRIGRMLEVKYETNSMTFVVQDGKFAGQTVPRLLLCLLYGYIQMCICMCFPEKRAISIAMMTFTMSLTKLRVKWQVIWKRDAK